MSHRFFQLQDEAAHGSRSSSPHRSSHSHSHSHHHKSSSSHHSHRPQPQTTPNYAQRTSTSSDSSSGSSSYSSSYSSSGYNYYDSAQQQTRYSMDAAQPRVEVMRCSRCAKSVETITSARTDDTRRVSSDDASASGMVRFGHNLYYCDRCARMVGYK
jgi:hypothetical protein